MASTKDYFPSLPPYTPPTTGIFSFLDPCLHPYVQLMRLDRPKPSIYFYLPHLLGSLQASIILQVPLTSLLEANLFLLAGTFFLRGATCTWNDIVDVDFDKRVERTRHRALARGAITLPAAFIFMLVQALCAATTLLYMPAACSIYAVPGMIGWVVYPLAKRFTDYPQIILGFPMAWGVFMGAAAVGADPLHASLHANGFIGNAASLRMDSTASRAIVYVYLANVCWTLCYETVYSYQDVRDDVAAGVKNIALLLGQERAKPFLSVVSVIDISLLFAAGVLMNASWPYHIFSVGLKGLGLATKIVTVNLQDPRECLWWFRDGGYINGGALVAGFVLQYLSQLEI